MRMRFEKPQRILRHVLCDTSYRPSPENLNANTYSECGNFRVRESRDEKNWFRQGDFG
jgi:hypothetical protein